MASYTQYLKLFKYNMSTDTNNPISIEQALNENWDKIDNITGDIIALIDIINGEEI